MIKDGLGEVLRDELNEFKMAKAKQGGRGAGGNVGRGSKSGGGNTDMAKASLEES